jgi:Na+-translocating ferredoxin:NAD+ oxidoreductase RnfE subunit
VNYGKNNARQSVPRIFTVPVALGIVSAIGLVSALVGDNAWDVIGWLGLGIPLVVVAWCLLRRTTPPGSAIRSESRRRR